MLHEKGLLHCYLSQSIALLNTQAGFKDDEYNTIGDVKLGPMCSAPACLIDYPLEEFNRRIIAGETEIRCKCGNGYVKPR